MINECEKMELFIEEHITLSRLKTYLDKSNNNLKRALILYEINISYSSELYKLLSILEISLRNHINRRCIKLFGDDWMTNIKYGIHFKMMEITLKTTSATEKTRKGTGKIFSIQEDIIDDTIKRLDEDHKPIDSDNLVSNVVFGFWTNLFNRAYENILWDKSLTNIFNNQFGRKEIEHILNELRQLRNRIAHHECIMNAKYKPQKHYKKIINLLEAIDPKLSNWAKKQINRKLFE